MRRCPIMSGAVARVPMLSAFLARARRPSSGGGGVVAGRRCSYGDAADRQRDRANGGLALWGVLALEFWWLPAAGELDRHLALKITPTISNGVVGM